MEYTTLTVRVPLAIAQQLDQLAVATGRPRSHVMRLLLSRAAVDDLPRAWLEAADIERVAAARHGSAPVGEGKD